MSERSARTERVRLAVNWTALAILTALGCLIVVGSVSDSHGATELGLLLAVPATLWLGRRWFAAAGRHSLEGSTVGSRRTR